jgi:hypothetical protein
LISIYVVIFTRAEELLNEVVSLNSVAEVVVAELENRVGDFVASETSHLTLQNLNKHLKKNQFRSNKNIGLL